MIETDWKWFKPIKMDALVSKTTRYETHLLDDTMTE